MIVRVEEEAGRTVVTVLGGAGEARLSAALTVLGGLMPTPRVAVVTGVRRVPRGVDEAPARLARQARLNRGKVRVDSSGGDHLAVCWCGWRTGPFTTADLARESGAAHRCPA